MSADLAPRPGDALVVVDVQRDFLPGGNLAAVGGDAILSGVNGCLGAFAARQLPVFATRDWHPAAHCSFEAQGGPWPPHCVAGTPGAEFGPGLQWPPHTVIVSKATTVDRDAYSGFSGTDLEQQLRALGVTRLFVVGLATDYCVQQTVIDARAAGFDVVVLRDAIAAVDARPGDGERAQKLMAAVGARFVDSGDVPAVPA